MNKIEIKEENMNLKLIFFKKKMKNNKTKFIYR